MDGKTGLLIDKQADGQTERHTDRWMDTLTDRRQMDKSGNPCRRGKLGTVDLLALPSLDEVVLILKMLFTSFMRQVILIRRSTVLSHPLKLMFPGQTDGRKNGWKDSQTSRLKDGWTNRQVDILTAGGMDEQSEQ